MAVLLLSTGDVGGERAGVYDSERVEEDIYLDQKRALSRKGKRATYYPVLSLTIPLSSSLLTT
eukprot:scaffold3357_cov268-Chaetoceros_neogracile.AAC.5